ncbi:pyridoxal phosphate-dependent transferase [Cercophora scortea]|uniref:Pyridoxal phosphate-dependent transferase n=1 Tax=Cercophora scortea TaxID=314031 RepID=A0AAE0IFB1_9PEZI|nr:pyridoxal phosphate-dependent transferase [Cercophora scortea]
MDSEGFREAAVSSIDEIISYFDNISTRSVVSTVEPGYLRKLLPSTAPEDGEPWADIQRDMEAKILPGITHWQHPGFHAFFPCATSYPSILGELYSSALSGACFNWICSPAVTELETIVLDWLARMLGLPDCYLSTGPTRGGGVIQGSASEAVVTAMVAARDKYLRETTPTDLSEEAHDDFVAHKRSRMVALATTMTHSSTKKAAIILGVRFQAIPVRAEDNYALTMPVLAAALANCRARGLEPFFLTATLGTTDTCAVDDFAGITAALESHNPPTPQASFDMNMHKWLLTNFDASCLFVRNRNWFIQALSINQAIYSTGNSGSASPSDGGLVTDYREWQIPLGRRFRSLKIWFVMRTYGVKGLQAYIRRTTALGEDFAAWMRAREDLFEILTGPSFSLTVFRVKGATEEESNARTKRLCDGVNASGKIWVSNTVLDGKFAIRMMTGVRATEKEHVEAAFKLLVDMAGEIVKS